jgi:acyl-CoA thioesterase-2
MTLEQILSLSPLGGDRFEGHVPDDGWRRVFGGLAVAQSVVAAYGTVEARTCHSLHSYFLRAGDPARAIDYAVERVRDGASFSVRRVTASQEGSAIFAMMASFQKPQQGAEHQLDMPEAPPPEDLTDEFERWRAAGDALPAGARALASRPQRVEMRWAGPPTYAAAPEAPPNRAVWMRVKERLPNSLAIQQAALAYASDMTFLSTALAVHGLSFWSPQLQTASLDHAIWLHRPTDFSQWHLYAQEAVSTSGGRGIVQGRMYRRDGTLVASMTQEGLMRLRGRSGRGG